MQQLAVRNSSSHHARRGRTEATLPQSDAAKALVRGYHQHHRLGAGPTIHSTVSVSSSADDFDFVQAAARGDLEATYALLPSVSSVDVRIRPVTGHGLRGRPASALHAAAAAGAVDVGNMLLRNGADPSARLEWLRALTPLHVASTVQMARCLLLAGAKPIAVDPREPDPVWYQRRQGRHDVADVIAAARAAMRSAAEAAAAANLLVSRPSSSHGSRAASATAKRVVPSLTAADLTLVKATWGTTAAEAASAVSNEFGGSTEDLQSFECAVCMGPITLSPTRGEDDGSELVNESASLVRLPCGKHGETPHLYHAECLDRWLLRKADCPVCRRDVRPMLRNAIPTYPSTLPQQQSQPPNTHQMQQQQQQQQMPAPAPSSPMKMVLPLPVSRPQSRKEHVKQQERQRRQQQELLFLHGRASQPRPQTSSPRIYRPRPASVKPSASMPSAPLYDDRMATISMLESTVQARALDPHEALALQSAPRVLSPTLGLAAMRATSSPPGERAGYVRRDYVRKHAATRDWRRALNMD